jgi:hypothetical protein
VGWFLLPLPLELTLGLAGGDFEGEFGLLAGVVETSVKLACYPGVFHVSVVHRQYACVHFCVLMPAQDQK